MSAVVVTGGSGFIGGHLVDGLVEQGDDVTVLDNRPVHADAGVPGGVRVVECDIRDRESVDAAIPPGTDTVYHMAAVVGVDRYLAQPLDVIDVTMLGTRAVLDAAHRVGAKVVLASTSEVFGRNPVVPWTEDADRVLGSTATERWTYSSSKALAEHMAFAFIRQYGLDVTIVRYFNVYGPRQRPAFVVSRSVHRALRGLPPVVYDDGGQARCFTFIADAVAATLLAGSHPKAAGECFNIGGSTETPVRRVAELVSELTGVGPDIVPVDTATRLGGGYQDLYRRIPDSTKARETIGWRPAVELREGLARTIEWARANPWWLDRGESGFG